MRWRLFELAAGVSLLLGIATVVLWVCSYSVPGRLERRRLATISASGSETHAYQLAWTRGQMRFIVARDTLFFAGNMRMAAVTPDDYDARWSCERLDQGRAGSTTPPSRTHWNRLGFASWEDAWTSSFARSRRQVRAAPIWPGVLAFAVLPGIYTSRQVRRWRRGRAGRCPACGYDLRATRNRCPECGTPAGNTTTTAV